MFTWTLPVHWQDLLNFLICCANWVYFPSFRFYCGWYLLSFRLWLFSISVPEARDGAIQITVKFPEICINPLLQGVGMYFKVTSPGASLRTRKDTWYSAFVWLFIEIYRNELVKLVGPSKCTHTHTHTHFLTQLKANQNHVQVRNNFPPEWHQSAQRPAAWTTSHLQQQQQVLPAAAVTPVQCSQQRIGK